MRAAAEASTGFAAGSAANSMGLQIEQPRARGAFHRLLHREEAVRTETKRTTRLIRCEGPSGLGCSVKPRYPLDSVAVTVSSSALLPPWRKAVCTGPALTCGFAVPDFLLGGCYPQIPPSRSDPYPLVTGLLVNRGNSPPLPYFSI